MSRRRNRILVPEAQDALNRLKCEVVKGDGVVANDVNCSTNPNDIKYAVAKEQHIPLQRGDNGDLTTRQVGKVGGAIGGSMVRRLVEIAQQQLTDEQANSTDRNR